MPQYVSYEAWWYDQQRQLVWARGRAWAHRIQFQACWPAEMKTAASVTTTTSIYGTNSIDIEGRKGEELEVHVSIDNGKEIIFTHRPGTPPPAPLITLFDYEAADGRRLVRFGVRECQH